MSNIEDMQRKISRSYYELHSLHLKARYSIHEIEPSFAGEGAFICILIGLSDILRFLDNLEMRIDFTDDFAEGDLTDNVYKMRNACCHIGSKSREVFSKGTTVSFMIGHPGGCLKFQGPEGEFFYENPYEDDISFHYGRLRLFQVRHIQRAIAEAKIRLDKLSLSNDTQAPSWFGMSG